MSPNQQKTVTPNAPVEPVKKKKSKRVRRLIAAANRRKRILANLAQVYGWICAYCSQDVSATSGVRPTLDHVVPLSAGGKDHESNMKIACEFCQRAKADKPLAVFLRWVKWVQSSTPRQ